MPYSVLIVEDDGFVGVELETTLSENGYDPLPLVKTYGDALQAVNSASFSYCVLVTAVVVVDVVVRLYGAF